jgi:hypothetical protein
MLKKVQISFLCLLCVFLVKAEEVQWLEFLQTPDEPIKYSNQILMYFKYNNDEIKNAEEVSVGEAIIMTKFNLNFNLNPNTDILQLTCESNAPLEKSKIKFTGQQVLNVKDWWGYFDKTEDIVKFINQQIKSNMYLATMSPGYKSMNLCLNFAVIAKNSPIEQKQKCFSLIQ